MVDSLKKSIFTNYFRY